MELLDAFEHFHYRNDIDPGIHDIHSANIPGREQIAQSMRKAAERLWVNPDCGLIARQWNEPAPVLRNRVAAAKSFREIA